MAILKSNKLGNQTIYKFVKQNTTSIFKTNPAFTKFTNFITDLGAKINILKEGAGLKQKRRRKKK